jgi:hypothetical protein
MAKPAICCLSSSLKRKNLLAFHHLLGVSLKLAMPPLPERSAACYDTAGRSSERAMDKCSGNGNAICNPDRKGVANARLLGARVVDNGGSHEEEEQSLQPLVGL